MLDGTSETAIKNLDVTMASDYVPLGEREEWKDVTPIPQDDGENPLVPIMYTEEYRDAMDYFRAVSAAGEHSERVLELTESIIRKNPSHYTVWQYRFNTLVAMKADLDAELDLMNEFARENLKSYQVWHHRLLLLSHLSPEDPGKEIAFIHESLIPDAKNYHTWAYLHWLYCHFGALGRISDARWAAELAWCEGMLADDPRNNSAWGWRWFLRMAPRAGAAPAPTPDRVEAEIGFALREIHRIPHNASAWNYLRGAVRCSTGGVGGADGGADGGAGGGVRAAILPVLAPYLAGSAVAPPPPEEVSAWPTRTRALDAETPTPVPLALEFQADAAAAAGRAADAAAIYGQLAAYADTMRGAYWEMRRAECVNA